MGEPHQQTGDQKQQSTQSDDPEVHFLTAVEESHFFRLEWFFIGRVQANFLHPSPIGVCPHHRSHPIKKLEEEKDLEHQTEPWVQQPSTWAASKERRNPAKQPG